MARRAIALAAKWVDPRNRRATDDVKEAARETQAAFVVMGFGAKMIDLWMLGIGEPRRL